jgi:hypothetical protein
MAWVEVEGVLGFPGWGAQDESVPPIAAHRKKWVVKSVLEYIVNVRISSTYLFLCFQALSAVLSV